MNINDKIINIWTKIAKIFNGSFLRKIVVGRWKFIIYLLVLSLIYIYNRYNAEQNFYIISKTKEEIKVLTAEYVKSEYMLLNISTEAAISDSIKKYNLNIDLPKKTLRKIYVKPLKNEQH